MGLEDRRGLTQCDCVTPSILSFSTCLGACCHLIIATYQRHPICCSYSLALQQLEVQGTWHILKCQNRAKDSKKSIKQ